MARSPRSQAWLLLERVKVVQPSWGAVIPVAGKGQLAAEPSKAPVTLAPSTCDTSHNRSQSLLGLLSGPCVCAEPRGEWSEWETWSPPSGGQGRMEWVGLHPVGCQVHRGTDQEEFQLAGPGKASLRSWHWSQPLEKSRISINRAHGVEPCRLRAQPEQRVALRGQGVPLKLNLQVLFVRALGILFLLSWGHLGQAPSL